MIGADEHTATVMRPPETLGEVCAIDETWSGIELVVRKEMRGA